MNLINKHIINNNLLITISKGDLYGIPFLKSALARINGDHLTSGLYLPGCSLSKDNRIQRVNNQFTVFEPKAELLAHKRSNIMETQHEVPGGDMSIVDHKNKNHQTICSQTISKRSNIMKNSTIGKYLGRGISALLILALIATMAMGQNLVIGNAAATFAGAGTITVKGNISNNTVAAPVTIANPVTLNGAAAQTVGTATFGAINFTTLNVLPTAIATTTLNVASSISTAVTIGAGAINATLAVGANNTLTIGGTSAFGNAGSALNTVATSTVVFNQAAAGQVVLGGFTYNGLLTLSGGAGATKTLNAAALTSVGQAFDASGAGLLTISGGGLTLGTTGSFAAAAISSGTITGGSGLATFNGLLTKTGTGNLTSGSGNLSLLAGLTNTAGNITLAAGQSMSVSGGQFAYTAGALTFPLTSTVTYGALATTIVDVPYGGNLTLNADPKTWTLAAARTVSGNLTLGAGATTTIGGAFDLNVGGNISLASNLTKSANAVVFANAASAVSGTGFEITGSVTRTHAFVVATPYTFNNASMTMTPTAITTLTSYTINSLPSIAPTGYLAGNSVNRKYSESYTSTGFTATLQLAYLASEYTGSNAAKMKDFQNGIAKANKLGGAYTRASANGFNYVSLPGLTNAILISGQELGLDDRYNMFISVNPTAWDVASTWDMASVPGAADDVEISAANAVTIPLAVPAVANSVVIDAGATGGLTLSGTSTLAVGAGGLQNDNTNTGLVVGAGTAVTVTGGNLTNNGKITNAGAITVQ
jgi:fibronectin-binding autotransporter adhesin